MKSTGCKAISTEIKAKFPGIKSTQILDVPMLVWRDRGYAAGRCSSAGAWDEPTAWGYYEKRIKVADPSYREAAINAYIRGFEVGRHGENEFYVLSRLPRDCRHEYRRLRDSGMSSGEAFNLAMLVTIGG